MAQHPWNFLQTRGFGFPSILIQLWMLVTLALVPVRNGGAEEAPAGGAALVPGANPATAGDPAGQAAGAGATATADAVRFLDAFPGSPRDQAALVADWQAAQVAKRWHGTQSAEVWSPEPVGVWMHGPVPSRITPTLMLMAWQRVLSEHYADSLLTFAPRIRQWGLRVIARIGSRLDALAPAVAAGDKEKAAEKARLTDLAHALSLCVQLCPGPADRTTGLPGWVGQEPGREGLSLLMARILPCNDTTQLGLAADWSNNLAALQTFEAVVALQHESILSGEERYRWGGLIIGLLLQDREDFRLLADLNGWLSEYSCDAPLNDDYLSLAAVSQIPTDPDARKIWQDKLNARFNEREQALLAAGCTLPPMEQEPGGLPWPHPSPACGTTWQLLPWRSGPLDGFAPFHSMSQLVPGTFPESPLAKVKAEAMAEVLGVGRGLDGGAGTPGETQSSAVRAVLALRNETAAVQVAGWCLLKPDHFLCSPPRNAPLLDDAGPGTVWIDGEAGFYAALASAARSHEAYLRGLGIDTANAAGFASLCAQMEKLRARLDADTDTDRAAGGGNRAGAVAAVTRTRGEVQALMDARQWLGEWLAVELEPDRAPRALLAPVRNARGAIWGRKETTSQVTLYCVNEYAIRPCSAAGVVAEENAMQPVLTAGVGIRLAGEIGVVTDSGWTAETLQKRVLGPEGQGPVQFLEFLDPPALAEWALVGKSGVAIAAGARHEALAWMVRDPGSFAAAVEANPRHGDDDRAAWLSSVVAHAPAEDLALVRQLLEKWPQEQDAILSGLARNPAQPFGEYLGELARQPVHTDAIAYLAKSSAGEAVKSSYLDWLETQADPLPGLAGFAQAPDSAQASRWIAWLAKAKDPATRGLLLANLAPLLDSRLFAFQERVRLGFHLAKFMRDYGEGPVSGRSWPMHGEPVAEVNAKVLAAMVAAAQQPEIRAVAMAALAISDNAEAYALLSRFLKDPQNAAQPLDPAQVILLGTSVVSGERPEAGREMLRAWIKQPVMGADGKPRAPSLEENQTWALGVELLRRDYILTDAEVPALVDRYVEEIGVDVQEGRMRFPTHAAFATAFFVNREMVLDRVAAALDSADLNRRDAALAIFTTQTRVDALNGARPEGLPALENLPLRLEGVAEPERKAQAAVWKEWLRVRRGAVLNELQKHLE